MQIADRELDLFEVMSSGIFFTSHGDGIMTNIDYEPLGRAQHFDHIGVNNTSFDYNPAN